MLSATTLALQASQQYKHMKVRAPTPRRSDFSSQHDYDQAMLSYYQKKNQVHAYNLRQDQKRLEFISNGLAQGEALVNKVKLKRTASQMSDDVDQLNDVQLERKSKRGRPSKVNSIDVPKAGTPAGIQKAAQFFTTNCRTANPRFNSEAEAEQAATKLFNNLNKTNAAIIHITDDDGELDLRGQLPDLDLANEVELPAQQVSVAPSKVFVKNEFSARHKVSYDFWLKVLPSELHCYADQLATSGIHDKHLMGLDSTIIWQLTNDFSLCCEVKIAVDNYKQSLSLNQFNTNNTNVRPVPPVPPAPGDEKSLPSTPVLPNYP